MMISNKKSYAMKMLQLALALSLLHVDPDNYLEQHLRNWDSQLELRNGDGWELEMLRAVPMVEYPYANRKTMMPLIEDLVRYDRQNDPYNQYNVTAYLLNVQTDTANQTAAVQELQATGSTTTSSNTVTVVSAGATALEQAAAVAGATVNSTASTLGIDTADLDLFLNSEQFQDHRSIWEQNLADLQDFGDLTVLNPYAGLPLKDEPQDNGGIFDLHLDVFLPSFAGEEASGVAKEEGPGAESGAGAGALNDTFPDPSDPVAIKVEQADDDHSGDLVANVSDEASCSSSSGAAGGDGTLNCIKKERDEGDEGANAVAAHEEVDLSPFISQADMIKEESEIVEVLWKQDVDLGYSLTSAQNLNGSSTSGNGVNISDDEIEKLKALEELKLDKPSPDSKNENNVDDIGDEWAGIPFMVDNETGEYIRLPLDELLDDVLQLTELAGQNNEVNDDSVASTSKAAAAKNINNSNNKIKVEDENAGNNNNINLNGNNNNNNNNFNVNNNHIDNALQDITNTEKQNNSNNKKEGELSNDDDLPQSEIEVSSLPSPLFDLDDEAKEELADFDIMLQSAAPPFHHHPHHPHRPTATGVQGYAAVGGGANSAFHRQAATGFHHGHHQGRMPLSRSVSMEQRLQDIASLFNPISSMGVVGGVSDMPPYPHYPTHHYSYQGAAGIPAPPQHAQYPPPPPPPHPHHHSHHAMLHPNTTLGDICPTQPHYGHNLGSAVTSSMHLTNASHEGDVGAGATGGGPANVGAYKMEHDMMYYSNASSDMNHTTDGFINSILNDEDLHLMDMNVNDSFCRMVDVNNSTSNNSSVLGISSGHGSSAGSGGVGGVGGVGVGVSVGGVGGGSNGGAGGATSNGGISMSGAVAGAGAAGGMTSDLMGSTNAAGDRLDASSDSAVSSMGSERVPSLSDGEWGEGSDSAQDYHQGKYGGPYDYSYNNSNRLTDGTRQPPVAQKKHQMFGKRFLNEQPGLGANGPVAGAVPPTGNGSAATEANGLLHGGPAPSIKYEYEPYPTIPALPQAGNGGGALGEGAMGPALTKEQQAYDLKYGPGMMGGNYSLNFTLRAPRTPDEIVHHNHTYTIPQGTGSLPRPQQRDKKISTSSSKSSKSTTSAEEEHLTRDEKRARALNIPIAVTEIINLPMDEFNERLSKYDLTENQLSLIRDIRRRGKNKVAAQNCRKRKLDQILSLEDEVKEVRRRKDQLIHDRETLAVERIRISNKFAALHRHIFQYLRDPEGNPCSPSEYSLQQAADGSIYLLPRDSSNKADTAGGPGNGNSGNGPLVNHQTLTAPPPQQQNHHMSGHHQQQQQQQQHALTTQPHAHLSTAQASQHQQQQQQPQQQQPQQQQHPHQQHPHVHHQSTHQKD